MLDYVAPRTPTEEGIAEVWSQVLDRSQVGVHDDFFELGGHSLLATQVISRIRNTFQMELPLRTLFEARTIAGLAKWIADAHGGSPDLVPSLVRESREGLLPLSFAQQRLWLAHRLDPDNPAYNVPCIVRITGKLSTSSLRQALAMLIERHEILRTTYIEHDGLPTQVIASTVDTPFKVVNISEFDVSGYDDALRLAGNESRVPFDLRSGPVLRATLFSFSQTDHVFALIMHHIVSDGWSVPLMLKELLALYDALNENRPHTLKELPVQYVDYAIWLRNCQESEAVREQTVYWQAKLAGAPQSIALPFDRPRPRKRSLEGSGLTWEINPAVADGLRSIAIQESATLFMILLACFKATLYSLYQDEDIVVGTDIAGRNRMELEGMVGFFINNLALRTSLSGNPTLRELVTRVRHVALEAYANQDVPFDKMVDLLRPERDPAYTPLFQVLFVLQNTPSVPAASSSITLTPTRLDTCTSKFDLALFVREREDDRGLRGHWVYSTDLFERNTIRSIAERFETIASLLVSAPETRLSDLKVELLTADTVRHRRQQQRRDTANYSRFQRVKPQALAAVETSPESDR